jgi:hypothetical protein
VTGACGTGSSQDPLTLPRPGPSEARTTRQRNQDRLSGSPGELIAAIPALLSFVPDDSVVIAGLVGDGALRTVEVVLRLDPPAPAAVPAALLQLGMVIHNSNHVDVVELLIVGCATEAVDLPHREFVDKLIRVVQDAGVTVGHVLWAERIEPGAAWRSYTDSTQTGTIADLSPFAATETVIHASRAEFAAQLEADAEEDLNRRAALLPGLRPVCPKRDLAVVHAILDRIATDPAARLALDDDTLVLVGHALTHPLVREACLEFALTEQAASAQHLWRLLIRALPRSLVAAPAALLAANAYLRGEGALTAVAIETARAANPHDRLANFMKTMVNTGVPPSRCRHLITGAFEKARAEAASRSASSEASWILP